MLNMYDLLAMFHTILKVIDEEGHLQEFHSNFGEPINSGIEFMQHMCDSGIEFMQYMCERDTFKREGEFSLCLEE